MTFAILVSSIPINNGHWSQSIKNHWHLASLIRIKMLVVKPLIFSDSNRMIPTIAVLFNQPT